MYNQLIKIYLEIIFKIKDMFPNGIGKYDKIKYGEFNSYFTILYDLRLDDTIKKLESGELPDDIVIYRLSKIAKHYNF